MLLPDQPTLLTYIVVGLVALSQLPRFGRAVLAFLRDLDEYKADRRGGNAGSFRGNRGDRQSSLDQ